MIVCQRCGHENADGRNLCQRCRAYLGWAKAGVVRTAPDGEGTAPAPIAFTPQPVQAAITPVPPPPATPIAPSQPAATPPSTVPPPRPPVPTPRPEPALSMQSPTSTHRPTAPTRTGQTALERQPAPPPITPSSTAPRQVTVGQLQPIPTVIAATPVRYQPTAPPTRELAGPSGSQPFEAIRPDATGPAASAADRHQSSTDLNAHGLLPANIALETAVRCPNCGRISPKGSRFCRCGTTLITAATAPDWEDPEERLPWYWRIRDGIGAGSRFWRSMRHANQGIRARFNRGQSIKNHAIKLLAVAGIGAVGVGMLGPWGGNLRIQAWQQVSNRLPWSYTTVAATGATTDPATKNPLDGFAVSNAVDLDSGTAWATPYAAPKPGPPCARPSGAARLVITFASPVAVDRVTVLPGLPATSFDRNQQSRPHTVDVLLSSGTCKPVTLTDLPAGQSIDISGRNITSITISVIDVYSGSAGSPAAGLVAISEVTAAYR